MPGRWTTLAIVLFWLAMMGWLTGRELWKKFGPPPRLEETLRAAANDGVTRWKLSHNYERIGWAETAVETIEGGGFALRQHIHFDKAGSFFNIIGLPVALFFPEAVDAPGDGRILYRLTPTGELESLSVDILREGKQVVIHFEGKPVGRELRVRATSPLLPDMSFDLNIPYDARNILHNSLCPLDRMPNLWPGRRWQAPMVDPARTLMSQMLERAPVEVTVREEPQNFYWAGIREWVSCFVVNAEMPNQDLEIEIYVQESDSRVLKQKVRWGTRILEIERAAPTSPAAELPGQQR